MKITFALLVAGLLSLSSPVLAAEPADMNAEILRLQQAWAHIKYEVADPDAQLSAMDSLAADASAVSQHFQGHAEPLIWQAIIVSTEAGMKGGLGALGKAKEAKKLLENAHEIDPNALNGSIETSLGSLYYQVPGFPIGFGSDKVARQHLEKALAINPDGIDPNYFYGDFLYRQGEFEKAAKVLKHGLAAPDRPGRTVADKGRRAEIHALLSKVQTKLASAS